MQQLLEPGKVTPVPSARKRNMCYCNAWRTQVADANLRKRWKFMESALHGTHWECDPCYEMLRM